MDLKPALEIKDQIELLRRRGLIIEDFDDAYEFLISNNYYRLNIYFHHFLDEINHFTPGTSIRKIQAVYENDQFLRNKLLLLLEPAEIKFRAGLAYHLGLKYGPDCFYQPSVFSNRTSEYEKIKRNFEREIKTQSGEPVIEHHLAKYGGVFPVWVVVEFLSFNSVSRLFSSLKGLDKKIISNLIFGINEYYLESWIHSLCVLRNICAHYGFLHQRKYSIKPRLYKEWDLNSNSELSAVLFILRQITENDIWIEFRTTILAFFQENEAFIFSDYGFDSEIDKWL